MHFERSRGLLKTYTAQPGLRNERNDFTARRCAKLLKKSGSLVKTLILLVLFLLCFEYPKTFGGALVSGHKGSREGHISAKYTRHQITSKI